MRQTAHPIEDLTRVEFPVPLLAHVSPTAVWLPHASYDALLWSATTGGVLLAGERPLSFETRTDCQVTVRTWVGCHGALRHGGMVLVPDLASGTFAS